MFSLIELSCRDAETNDINDKVNIYFHIVLPDSFSFALYVYAFGASYRYNIPFADDVAF